MEYIIIAAAAFGGSLISGTIGWLKSGLPWDGRKFAESVLSGIGAALVFALAYQFNETGGIRAFDILAAIAAGAGIDNLVNRVAGLRNSQRRSHDT